MGSMAKLKLDSAEISLDPYPHLVSFPALPDEDYQRFKDAVPAVEAFDLKGNGTKLELDIVENGAAFAALPQERREVLLELRQLLRNTAADLAGTFAEALRAKYVWLLGEQLARDVLAAGWTTTNGRVMGRAPGYRLDPHLDSAQQGMTCLFYLTDAPDAGGRRARFIPAREAARSPGRQHLLSQGRGRRRRAGQDDSRSREQVRLLRGRAELLHGFGRDSGKAQGWRFVYQCHVIPTGLKMDALAPRLPDEQRRRWEKYLRPTA